jgi:hypothetical protein
LAWLVDGTQDGDWTIISGWRYTYPSEKYEFVSWDDYSQLNGKIKFMFQTTNQILFCFPKTVVGFHG